MDKTLRISIMAVIVCFLMTVPVSAENAGAAKIKELFASKTFYLEYTPNGSFTKRKIENGTIGLAVKGNKVMYYGTGWFTNPIPFLGGLLGPQSKMKPEYYFDSKNYYSIRSKKEVIKATPEQLSDPYINPQDGVIITIYKTVMQIPENFGMFNGDSEIEFVESGKRAIDKKSDVQWDYDKYVKTVKDANNVPSMKKYFFAYYDKKGTFVGTDEITIEKDKDVDSVISKLNDEKSEEFYKYSLIRTSVNKITAELPKDAFILPENAKYYEPWLGDMNDLVEQRVTTQK